MQHRASTSLQGELDTISLLIDSYKSSQENGMGISCM